MTPVALQSHHRSTRLSPLHPPADSAWVWKTRGEPSLCWGTWCCLRCRYHRTPWELLGYLRLYKCQDEWRHNAQAECFMMKWWLFQKFFFAQEIFAQEIPWVSRFRSVLTSLVVLKVYSQELNPTERQQWKDLLNQRACQGRNCQKSCNSGSAFLLHKVTSVIMYVCMIYYPRHQFYAQSSTMVISWTALVKTG